MVVAAELANRNNISYNDPLDVVTGTWELWTPAGSTGSANETSLGFGPPHDMAVAATMQQAQQRVGFP